MYQVAQIQDDHTYNKKTACCQIFLAIDQVAYFMFPCARPYYANFSDALIKNNAVLSFMREPLK